jgi:hypothetical protein
MKYLAVMICADMGYQYAVIENLLSAEGEVME